MEDNISILHRGIEKAKKLIRDRYADKMYARGIEVVTEASRARSWTAFTGQSAAAYSVGVMKNGATEKIYALYDHGVQPVSFKVPYGVSMYLEHPMEGRSRVVHGEYNIEYDDVEEGAYAIFSRPYNPKAMCGVRFGYPIEYMNFFSYLTGGGTPIQLMRTLARIAMAGLR